MRKPRSGVCTDGATRYYASKHDCSVYPLKPKCTPSTDVRKIARERTRACAAAGEDRCLCCLKLCQEKGRDAVCPPEADHAPRPAAPARPERCKGRIPPRGNRSELAETGKTDPDDAKSSLKTKRTFCDQRNPARNEAGFSTESADCRRPQFHLCVTGIH